MKKISTFLTTLTISLVITAPVLANNGNGPSNKALQARSGAKKHCKLAVEYSNIHKKTIYEINKTLNKKGYHLVSTDINDEANVYIFKEDLPEWTGSNERCREKKSLGSYRNIWGGPRRFYTRSKIECSDPTRYKYSATTIYLRNSRNEIFHDFKIPKRTLPIKGSEFANIMTKIIAPKLPKVSCN